MAQRYDQVFGLEPMNRLVTLFADRDRNLALSPRFQTAADRDFEGDVAKWDEITYKSDLPPIVARDGAPKAMDSFDKKARVVEMVTFKQKSRIPASDVLYDRELGEAPTVKASAQARVAREQRQHLIRLNMGIEKLASQAFTGTISANTTNFPESDISHPDFTYAVQTTTQNGWSTAGTKILSAADAHLDKIKTLLNENADAEAAEVIHNHKISQYLLGNTEVQGWLQTTQQGVDVYRQGNLSAAGGFGGIPSWTEYDKGYVTAGGTFIRFVADNKAIVLPRDGKAELWMARGYGVVPAAAGRVYGEAGAIMPRRAPQAGFFSYAYIEPGHPDAIWIVTGWRGWPIIANPSAIVYVSTS